MLVIPKLCFAARLASASQVTFRRPSYTVRPSSRATSGAPWGGNCGFWSGDCLARLLSLHAAANGGVICGSGLETRFAGISPNTRGLKQSSTRSSPIGPPWRNPVFLRGFLVYSLGPVTLRGAAPLSLLAAQRILF